MSHGRNDETEAMTLPCSGCARPLAIVVLSRLRKMHEKRGVAGRHNCRHCTLKAERARRAKRDNRTEAEKLLDSRKGSQNVAKMAAMERKSYIQDRGRFERKPERCAFCGNTAAGSVYGSGRRVPHCRVHQAQAKARLEAVASDSRYQRLIVGKNPARVSDG